MSFLYLDFFNIYNNRLSLCSSENKILFGSVFKLLNMLFACFKKFLSSILSFQGKIIASKWMLNIKFIVCFIIENFNFFVHYYCLIYFCSVKYQWFIQYFFGVKINSLLISLLTFCQLILPSIFFIPFLGCLSLLIAF